MDGGVRGKVAARVTRGRRLLKPLLAVVIVGCIAFFFVKAFQRNWASIRQHQFTVSPGFLLGAGLLFAAGMLLSTWGWYTAVNGLSPQKVTFRQSVAVNNSSSLTKYIPGKIWSYALQLYWLDGLGISKALVVYVNLINLLISLAMTVMLGLGCLLCANGHQLPKPALLAALFALVAVDALSVAYNHALLRAVISLANRLFKRNIQNFDVGKALLVKLHGFHLLAAVVSGLSAYLFCIAIGYHLDLDRSLVIIGSTSVSDVVGFLAIVVPGGLGVREGLMYAILGGQASGSLALILPLGTRMLTMLIDVILGAVAFKLLSTLTRNKQLEA